MQQTLFNLGPDTAGQQDGEVFRHGDRDYLAILAPRPTVRLAFRPLRHRPHFLQLRDAYYAFVVHNRERIEAAWLRRYHRTRQET